MEGNRVRNVVACLAAAAIMVAASTASANVNAGEAGCRATIQKNTKKLAGTLLKAIDTCVAKAELVTGSPASCNSVAAADANGGAGKVAAAIAALPGAIGSKCTATEVALIPRVYNVCPSPGSGNPADFNQVSSCQATLNTTPLTLMRNYILNPNQTAILASPKKALLAKCAAAIGKNSTKLFGGVAKVLSKCQNTKDKALGPDNYDCGSPLADPTGLIGAAAAKAQAGIAKACGPATTLGQSDLLLLGSCASSSAAIETCVSAATLRAAQGLTASAYQTSPNAGAALCPGTVQVVINGGGKGGSRNSNTRLDTGWTGLGHDADVVDGFKGRVNISGCNSDCSTCNVTASCAEGNCRCSHDSTILCTAPFTQDVCGVGNTCWVHFGPPLPLSAGGAPTCIVNTIQTAFNGTANIGTGASSTPILNNAKVFSGIGQKNPCPTCSGASIGAAGTCAGGARNGLACTTNALNTTYGNTSYDCPPSLATNISGSGLAIDLTLTNGSVSLAAGDACDAPLGALSCFCGGCSLLPTKACQVDADCVGFGTCNNAGGPARQPNACSDLTCNAGGVCNAGPVDGFCDGLLKTNGLPYITCLNNGDCTAADPTAGNCTITKNRPCFVSPITDTGTAGTDGAELVSTFCSGPTTSGGVNAAAGTPGPGRVHLDFDFNGLCPAPNTTRAYALGGANCN